MRRSSFPLMILVMTVLMTGYTNCSSYESASQGGFLGFSSSSSSGDQDSDYGQVKIKIGSADPLVIQKGDIGFNTGGECFDGYFPVNEIKWKLTDVNGGSPIFSSFRHQCVDGRFHLLVQFLSGFNYEVPHTLEIEFIVYDQDGFPQEPIKTSINIIALDPLS